MSETAQASLMTAYFRLRALSDTAFKAGNGAQCTGAALAACLVAEQFKLLENLNIAPTKR